MMPKGQSAIEFVSTYGFVFIIIALAITVVFILGSAAPNIARPAQCTLSGGFTCSYAVYSVNSGSAGSSVLMVIATDTVPGVVNVSSFNAIVGSLQSTSGICIPGVATSGQNIYCVASFNGVLTQGTYYSGTFNITANYCPQRATQIYNYTCPSNSNFTYAGSLQAQAQNLSLLGGGGFFVIANVLNTANQPIPAQSDLQIQFAPNTYNAYSRTNLGNLRFYDGAKELYSWCEANCTNSSTGNALFWVRSYRPIPANNGLVQLQLYFLPSSIQYDGQFAGQSPTLSSKYAQYDNGWSVFPSYQNFAGTTAPNGWNCTSMTINNGATTNGPSASYCLSPTTYGLNANQTLDAYGVIQTTSANGVQGVGYIDGINSIGPYVIWGFSAKYSTKSIPATRQTCGGCTNFDTANAVQLSGSNIYSVYWPSSSTAYMSYNYGTKTPETLYIPTNQTWFGIGGASSGSALGPIYWIRIRSYPPNGVQPALTYSKVKVV